MSWPAGNSSRVTARGSLLLRVRGGALLLAGDKEAAAEALQDALAEARAADEHYEVALILDALLRAGLGGPEMEAERDARIAALGVKRLPFPLTAQQLD